MEEVEIRYVLRLLQEDGIDISDPLNVVKWVIANYNKIDLSSAETIMSQFDEQDKTNRVTNLKQELIDLGETDPYLEK